ncbi:MAG: hypothetical protein ACI8W8_003378 [Rhodothermales bacterium]|jgi:hypothetical protein
MKTLKLSLALILLLLVVALSGLAATAIVNAAQHAAQTGGVYG